MSPTRGQQLQHARTQAGLALPELSSQTNIPLGHLRALEADDLGALPEAVYVQAYVRTLEDLLGVQLGPTGSAAMPEVGQTLRRTRAVASLSMFLLVFAAAIVAFQRLPDMPEIVGDSPSSNTLTVKVQATDEGTLRAWVDGALVVDESYPKPTDESKKDEGEKDEKSREHELHGQQNVTIQASPVGAFRY